MILVTDDEAGIREVIKRILEEKGYRAVVARNGVEAIAILTANLSDIKAVVLDMIMPEMDGTQALFAIRRMSSDLPVLAMSGSMGSTPFGDDAATSFLPKPFGKAELLPALRALLDREGGRLAAPSHRQCVSSRSEMYQSR